MKKNPAIGLTVAKILTENVNPSYKFPHHRFVYLHPVFQERNDDEQP